MLRLRRILLLVTGLLLLVVPIASANVGPLTSGNYTYLVEGREQIVPVDILPVKGGYLVPVDLITQFDITVEEPGQVIRLKRGPVVVEMQAGSTIARVDGERHYLTAAPAKLAGRTFVPHEILPELAVEVHVDGKMVTLANYRPLGGPTPAPTSQMFETYALRNYFRDGSATGHVTAVTLNYDLLSHENLGIRWGMRQKLQRLMADHLLIHYSVFNNSLRAVRFDHADIYLVDLDGRQYAALPDGELAVRGLVSQPTAPFARQSSVLVYPKIDSTHVYIYHNPTGETLGRLRIQ